MLTYTYRDTQQWFQGAAADAFREQVRQLQHKAEASEHVIDRYSQNSRDTGHAIQAFGANVWELVRQAHQKEAQDVQKFNGANAVANYFPAGSRDGIADKGTT